MAGAEVTVSPGHLMAVKEEEAGESSGNDHKAQVILHLQPILHGPNDDTADTGTTVLAIETHHEDSKADGEEIEYGYPITCGDSRAVLLFKKFVCPGINVRCVKFNDQLISPKQFVHLAGKATLKDWKRAIRLGGVMLRGHISELCVEETSGKLEPFDRFSPYSHARLQLKMMDSGQIDFYQHDTVCSNTCRSTKFDVLINSARFPPGTLMQPSPSCLALDHLGGQMPPLTEDVVHDSAEAEEHLEEKLSTTAEWSSGSARPVNPTTANGHPVKRKRADTPDGVLSLWRSVADSGLMGEVLSSLQTELLATLKGVEARSEKSHLQETDAIVLNSLCKMFGLLDSVKQALDLKRSQEEEHKIHNGNYALDEILEDQRKQGRVKMKSFKHAGPECHGLSNKRQSHNLLPHVKTSPGIQPPFVAGLPAASYAQLPINPQLFAHSSASDGQQQHHGDRGATLEREPQLSEMVNQRLHRLRQEAANKKEVPTIKEPIQRTVKLDGDPYLRSEETDDTEGVHDIEKVVLGRKVSKKHKSK